MIYEQDRNAFSTMMDVVWQSNHRQPVDKETKRYWFNKLQHFPLGTVESAFDNWLITTDQLPTIKDIIKACAPKADFHRALGVVRDEDIQQAGLQKINQLVSAGLQPKTDHKAWAKRIMANQSAYLDIAVKYAKQALYITDTREVTE
jgi:hypothetical protein